VAGTQPESFALPAPYASSAGDGSVRLEPAEPAAASVGPDTIRALRRRRAGERSRRRHWLVMRLLVCADLAGLVVAFSLSELLIGGQDPAHSKEWIALILILPAWLLTAEIYGLYDRDEERADHSTVDDVVGVFHLVTVGVWLLLFSGRVTGAAQPEFFKLAGFWLLAIVLITTARALSRAIARRSPRYVQNMVILGAGDVGQLVARKVIKHPECGIHLVGFVDSEPRERRPELAAVGILGPADDLPGIVRRFAVDRVVVAFSNEREVDVVAIVRSLRDLDVQVDIVPRLFDVIGPRITNHTIETLPLVGLRPVRPSRSSLLVKRAIDIAGALAGLVVTAPLMLAIAVLIKRDSDGPVLFRQVRLGMDMHEFTLLKFRTMRVGADDAVHREYISQTMDARATVGRNGIYKLDRGDAVTRIGRWLRRLSLDELPQLVNVLRGEMSIVGPRPCLAYETAQFRPHQFERFLVPAGMTGLWQVAARANATFGEALDMDVAYARGWSLGLDLRLLCRTPLEILRQRGTA
jgi:exopolysaccharide biosynthesis polyprenyl glycosylphosphotransferase